MNNGGFDSLLDFYPECKPNTTSSFKCLMNTT